MAATVRFLAPGFALLLVAGSAAAQSTCVYALGDGEPWTMTFGPAPSDESLAPGASMAVPFAFTYDCAAAAQHAPRVPRLAVRGESTVEWGRIAVDPPTAEMRWEPETCPPDGSRTLRGNLTVGFDAEAPAFTSSTFVVSYDIENDDCEGGEQQWMLELKPAFVGGLSAGSDRTNYRAGPNHQIAVPLRLSNEANGQLKAFFEVVAVPPSDLPGDAPDSRRFQVVTPQPVILDSHAQGGTHTRRVVALNLNTPFPHAGRIDETWAFQVTVSARSAETPERVVAPQLVNFTVHVDGAYFSTPELPGFAAPTLGLAAALGVAWRRRR